MTGRGGATGGATGGARGIALINALVVVAAISAVAVALLARADAARLRLAEMRGADQAALYLDAAERLALLLIETDSNTTDTDHPGEPWAEAREAEEIDLGTAGWRISDLQGRFNVNWLADEPDYWAPVAREAFERLMQQQGLPADLAARLADALDPEIAPQNRRARPGTAAARIRPRPVLTVDELRLVEGLTEEDFARIAPFLAALPGQTTLNVNTASPEVLAAFLPDASVDQVSRALEAATRPFVDPDEFFYDIMEPLMGLAADDFPFERLDTATEWFEVRLNARLDRTHLRRTLVVRRSAEGGGDIVLSLPEFE